MVKSIYDTKRLPMHYMHSAAAGALGRTIQYQHMLQQTLQLDCVSVANTNCFPIVPVPIPTCLGFSFFGYKRPLRAILEFRGILHAWTTLVSTPGRPGETDEDSLGFSILTIKNLATMKFLFLCTGPGGMILRTCRCSIDMKIGQQLWPCRHDMWHSSLSLPGHSPPF